MASSSLTTLTTLTANLTLNSTPNRGRPIAATLPPEVIERILYFRFLRKGSYKEKKALNLALICQSWCAPVQRYLLKSIQLESVSDLDQLLRYPPTFAPFVQRLNIDVANGSGRWRSKVLNSLLKSLPQLRSLTLLLNEWSPGKTPAGDYFRAIEELPNLKELEIVYANYDKHMMAARQILAATPNLTSLTIENVYWESSRNYVDSSSTMEITTFNFTRLTKLSLQGWQLSSKTLNLKLLDIDTLMQVRDMRLGFAYRDDLLGNVCLLEQIGLNLETLALPYVFHRVAVGDFLQHCPRLKTLIMPCPFDSLVAPPSLTKVKYLYTPYPDEDGTPDYDPIDCKWIMQQKFDTEIVAAIEDWGNIEEVEIENARPTTEVKNFIRGKGVTLTVNGTVFRPKPQRKSKVKA